MIYVGIIFAALVYAFAFALFKAGAEADREEEKLIAQLRRDGRI